MEIKVLHQVMEWNEDVSAQVRDTLRRHKVCLINVMGSPGAGKTTLLAALIARLREEFAIGVTDGACHIEAMSIQHILPQFDLDGLDVLFVENIGNLVCPAEFDIGENFRLTVLSIPEGDDKVAKYPLMFTDTDCLALTKCDMLPYFAFDLDRGAADYRGVNPQGPLFQLSARTGEGLDQLAGHLAGRIRAALA